MLWSNIWLEWIIIQILIIYSCIRLFSTEQYFKQLLNLINVIILMSIYLSLLQFELFACFMFLGEFTIIIFFYCLFLHLKINIQQQINTSKNEYIIWNLSLVIIVVYFLINENNILFNIEDLYLVWPDLYKSYSIFLLNDLIFFFYFFIKYHTFLYILIGVFLLVMTLVLLYFINLYCLISLNKNDIHHSTTSKLNIKKNLYEQTSKLVQKIFSNKK